MESGLAGSNPKGRASLELDPIPSSWMETLGGVTLFLLSGAFYILEEIPIDWIAPERITFRPALMLAILLLPTLGVAVGWMMDFPRWSYAYAGLSLFVSMYLANASTPGFSLFGIPLFGRDLWGWRAWIPPLLVIGTGLLVTRSFRPITIIFARIARDLTLVTYGMFGFLPVLVWLNFDEIDRFYSLPWMVAQALLATGVAIAYLRSRSNRQRVASLSAGVLVSLTIMAAGPILYQPGWANIPLTIFWSVAIGVFVLLPVFFSLAQIETGAKEALEERTNT